MPTYTYPDPASAGIQWRPESCEWIQNATVLESTSPYTGESRTVDMLGHRWGMSITYPYHTLEERPEVEAFWLGLRGGSGRVLIWDLNRPVPRGTLRGSPTLAAGAAQFATQLSISGSGTLLPGDKFKVANQVFVVRSASGLTVQVEHPVRVALSGGAPVIWDRPTVLMRRTGGELRLPREGARHPGFSVELIEVFQ